MLASNPTCSGAVLCIQAALTRAAQRRLVFRAKPPGAACCVCRFWPLSIGFPLGMWLVVRKPTGWRRQGLVLVAAIMLLVGLAAVIGAVRNIIVSFDSFTIFD